MSDSQYHKSNLRGLSHVKQQPSRIDHISTYITYF